MFRPLCSYALLSGDNFVISGFLFMTHLRATSQNEISSQKYLDKKKFPSVQGGTILEARHIAYF